MERFETDKKNFVKYMDPSRIAFADTCINFDQLGFKTPPPFGFVSRRSSHELFLSGILSRFVG
jgi:hypothetical protein